MDEGKPGLTDTERELAAKAARRVKARAAVLPPHVNAEPDAQTGYFSAPVAQEDWEPWAFMLLDAFGTRSFNVANAFMLNLKAMCPELWDGERHEKDPHAFDQALAIVASLRPNSEAEAAQAAGMVAVHFATMKVAENIGRGSSVHPQMAGALSGLVRTYSAGMQTMRGRKPKATRQQVIKVQKTVTVNYDARSVHLHGRGEPSAANQPHATEPQRARARRAGDTFEGTAMQCPDPLGAALSIASGERPEALPDARRGEGLGRADGEG